MVFMPEPCLIYAHTLVYYTTLSIIRLAPAFTALENAEFRAANRHAFWGIFRSHLAVFRSTAVPQNARIPRF